MSLQRSQIKLGSLLLKRCAAITFMYMITLLAVAPSLRIQAAFQSLQECESKLS